MRWGEPSFSEVLLGGYLGLLTFFWAALVASVGAWHRRWALPAGDAAPGPLPKLTICVPARDEAHQIEACVRAALAQDHPDLEVVVVDDGSTDGTGDIARAVGPLDERLRVVRASPPPSGWAGKPWACTRAAAEAHGQHLLFIDADVVLAPDAARRAASVLVAKNLAAVSLFGSWRVEGFWERVAIPVIGWFVRASVDMEGVNHPARPAAFANGQFILVDRDAYAHVGGHAAVRADVLEDVKLARTLKKNGLPIALYTAPDAFSVRLYRNLREILAGYGKNFYEGMDRRPHVAIGALLFLFVGALLPHFLLLAALVNPAMLLTGVDPAWPWQLWVFAVCALPVAFRWRMERADGRSGWIAWSHPLGNLVLAAVLVSCVFRVRTEWKGRTFHDGRAVG